MTDSEHTAPAGLRSIQIHVPGANCATCFNDAMEKVRHLAGVEEVRASMRAECIEVQHRDASIAEVVDTLRTYLHGTDDSSHEVQMVAVAPEVGASVSTAPPSGRASHDPT